MTRPGEFAFIEVVLSLDLFPAVRRVAVFLRLFCVLAVAVVTTFHTCGLATAQASQPVAICAAAEQDGSEQAGFSVEKCHICAVVSLSSLPVAVAAVDRVTCTAMPVQGLAPFTPTLTSPPPKA